MGFAKSPIFPNAPVAAIANLPSASATDTTIYTAPATYGAVLMGPLLAFKQGSATRTIDIKLTVGATTVTLARVALSGAQYSTVNLMSPEYIAGMSLSDPRLVIPPNGVLKITTTDSNAGIVDITGLNIGTYENAA